MILHPEGVRPAELGSEKVGNGIQGRQAVRAELIFPGICNVKR